MLYTNANIKIDFIITNNSVDIYPYINGNKMFVDNSNKNHKKINDMIKLSIFKQMYKGEINVE